MPQTLFRNARVFDGNRAELTDGQDVLIEGDQVREV